MADRRAADRDRVRDWVSVAPEALAMSDLTAISIAMFAFFLGGLILGYWLGDKDD